MPSSRGLSRENERPRQTISKRKSVCRGERPRQTISKRKSVCRGFLYFFKKFFQCAKTLHIAQIPFSHQRKGGEIGESKRTPNAAYRRAVRTQIRHDRQSGVRTRRVAQTADLPRKERKFAILSAMLQYFDDSSCAESYVNMQFERKLRNLICRRVRLTRKVNLQEFNYFCTMT